MTDYYSLLGVARTADPETIKKAYRKLAVRYHPDKNPGNQEAEQNFKQIAEAYDVLSDPSRRRTYDLLGDDAFRKTGCGSRSGTAGGSFGRFGSGGSFVDPREVFARVFEETIDKKFNPNNPFSNLMAGFMKEAVKNIRRDIRTAGKSDIQQTVSCSLEDVYTGTTKKFQIRRAFTPTGSQEEIQDVTPVELHIEPGTIDGAEYRKALPQSVSPNTSGGPAHVVFRVQVKKHPVFVRNGKDLWCERDISLCTALTGSAITIETLDHRSVDVPISGVIRPGTELVVEGEGMPIQGQPRRGDLVVKFNVVFPEILTQEQKTWLRRALQ